MSELCCKGTISGTLLKWTTLPKAQWNTTARDRSTIVCHSKVATWQDNANGVAHKYMNPMRPIFRGSKGYLKRQFYGRLQYASGRVTFYIEFYHSLNGANFFYIIGASDLVFRLRLLRDEGMRRSFRVRLLVATTL